jgi:hypothetical protein
VNRVRLLGLDAWWDEPDYRRSLGSFRHRGTFILRKLRQHDAVRLQTVLDDVFREEKDPQDITKFEWKVILEYIGASAEEIWDVQQRMGRPWR